VSLKKPQVVGFADYYLANDERIVEAARFIPMTPEQKQKSLDALAALKQKAGA